MHCRHLFVMSNRIFVRLKVIIYVKRCLRPGTQDHFQNNILIIKLNQLLQNFLNNSFIARFSPVFGAQSLWCVCVAIVSHLLAQECGQNCGVFFFFSVNVVYVSLLQRRQMSLLMLTKQSFSKQITCCHWKSRMRQTELTQLCRNFSLDYESVAFTL